MPTEHTATLHCRRSAQNTAQEGTDTPDAKDGCPRRAGIPSSQRFDAMGKDQRLTGAADAKKDADQHVITAHNEEQHGQSAAHQTPVKCADLEGGKEMVDFSIGHLGKLLFKISHPQWRTTNHRELARNWKRKVGRRRRNQQTRCRLCNGGKRDRIATSHGYRPCYCEAWTQAVAKMRFEDLQQRHGQQKGCVEPTQAR